MQRNYLFKDMHSVNIEVLNVICEMDAHSTRYASRQIFILDRRKMELWVIIKMSIMYAKKLFIQRHSCSVIVYI